MQTTRRQYLSAVGVGGWGSIQSGQKEKQHAIQQTSETGVDVGAVYIPFLGSKWGRCIDHEPSVGQYGIDDSAVINQQIQWMKDYGISTVMFNFGESYECFDRFHTFQEAELVDDIKIEIFWPINRVFQRDLDLERILDFIRSEFLKRDNYKQYNGRPVIQFWAAAYLRHHDGTRKQIIDEYGSLAAFVNHIRERLTVEGVDPYLIAHEPAPSVRPDYARAYDGYTSWFGPLNRLGTPTWQ
ncbi:MAG: hypothetical protein ABEI86_00620, partial [Halobacteriaceae archaeon]